MPSSYLFSQNTKATVCVIVGHSINAITTAAVLASLGQIAYLYADESALSQTLAMYGFEHQLPALWQLYITQKKVVVCTAPTDAKAVFDKDEVSVYWLFYPELPQSWGHKSGATESWVAQLNKSNSTQTPLILSGIDNLGTFADISQQCQRPWIYYVPFVFLQDGHSYASMLTPSLWLMGEKTPNSTHKVEVLQPLMAQANQSFITDIATVEFARSAIMSMLATRVSFMNEWSRLADHQEVDITEVSHIMGLDDRIGKSYLEAGWGFGGQTLPAELDALYATFEGTQSESRLMRAVNDINDDQKELIFRKFWQYFDGSIEDKVVSIWGASYKPGSGRTSAAAIHPLLSLLWSYNITTQVFAGEAQDELAKLYPHQPLLQFITQPESELMSAVALFIMAWPRHQQIPLEAINDAAIPVFDAQNVLTRIQINTLVGDYIGIGRRK